MYHPLVIFNGRTGHLATSLFLGASKTHASNYSVAILKRIVCGLRRKMAGFLDRGKADASFAVPALYDVCDRESISYNIALITNEHLKQMTEDLLEAGTQEHARTGKKARHFGEDRYGAVSWEKARRAVSKAEAIDRVTNRRFVVSIRDDGPKKLYKFYIRRGESKN